MKLFKKNELKLDFNNILSFYAKVNSLLDEDRYISKKEYLNDLDLVNNLYILLLSYEQNNLLQNICKSNKIDYNKIKESINLISNIEDVILKHNDDFINRHLVIDKIYFDNILKDVDPNIKLDDEQRIVALNDEDYSLIIAGAGAGKTTTLAAKVKYLVEKLSINPEEILIIAFTNQAVDELKEKIQKKLKLPIKITTFHKCGKEILNKDQDLSNASVLNENFYFINDFINKEIHKDKTLLTNLIMLFAFYIDLPENLINNISLEDHFSFIEQNEFSTLRSNLGEFIKEYSNVQLKKKISIKNELLKSNEEVQIANFLYLNSIDYEYEKIYPYPIPNAYKLYTPDFYIKQGDNECYIEHFGVTEDLKNNRYSEKDLQEYVIRMEYKKTHHKIHNTKLITTYSLYNDNRSLIDHLKDELIEKGFILEKRNEEEVYLKIKSNKDNKYIYKFTKLASTFIGLFKNKNYKLEDFERLRNNTQNPRNLLFIDIMEKLYLAYELYLKESKKIDFYDMINKSTRLLQEAKKVREQIKYKYILIDEFQDISRARMDLVTQIRDATNAKISVVGDDWQAIYGYAGADIDLFTNFEKTMGYASTLRITKTYRNSQELIDIAGNFIQKNNKQIKKTLTSIKKIDKPITIYTYDGSYKSKHNVGADQHKAELLEKVISLIIKLDGEKNKILVIGRYNFDGEHLIKTGLFKASGKDSSSIKSIKYPNVDLTFMTAHTTKGLTYDNVILINNKNDKYGFPSQIEDDPIYNLVRSKDESYDFSEERRLFYVALTRTKNRVFLLTPYQNPSKFILELIEDYEAINLHDEELPLKKDVVEISKKRLKCPVCGYPLQLKENKNYGLKLYICTNEPEICDYMTNNLKSGKIGIHLCDKCNGVMYVKPKKDKTGYIFGCSNYKHDGTGCNNIENIEDCNEDQVVFNNPKTENVKNISKEKNEIKNEITIKKDQVKNKSYKKDNNISNNKSDIYLGLKVKHKLLGEGQVMKIDSKYFFVLFDGDLKSKKFNLNSFSTYFKSR